MDVDPKTAMEVAKEGTKALNKFQDILSKIFGPRWTIKQADADAYADQRKIETIRNNPDMEIFYTYGEMSAREKTADELLEYRAHQRLLAETIRQEQCLERVISIAANEIKDDEVVSEDPLDEDWIIRFFDIAKNISSEKMQILWGKILAGEIKNVGSFSLRTLECVRNLSQKEALIFQKFIPLVLQSNRVHFILEDIELLKKYDIEYTDILRLEEIGLIQAKTGLSINYDVEKIPININNHDPRITIISVDGKKHHVSIPVVALTTIGIELYSIFTMDINVEYIIEFLRKKQIEYGNKNIKIRLNQPTIDIEKNSIYFKDLLTEE